MFKVETSKVIDYHHSIPITSKFRKQKTVVKGLPIFTILILYFAVIAYPLFWMIIKQDQLRKPDFLLKSFLISLILFFAGLFFIYNKKSFVQEISYFGSQTSLVFIILYKVIRDIYYPIFLREPELSKKPSHKIDILPTSIIFTGTITLPFIIDTYVTKPLLNKF